VEKSNGQDARTLPERIRRVFRRFSGFETAFGPFQTRLDILPQGAAG